MISNVISSIGLVLGLVGALLLVRDAQLGHKLAKRDMDSWKKIFEQKLTKEIEKAREAYCDDPFLLEVHNQSIPATIALVLEDDLRRTLEDQKKLRTHGAAMLVVGFFLQLIGLWAG